MSKFLGDAPAGRVVLTLQRLGFTLVREGNHISSMLRQNLDGTSTPLTIPNHLDQKIDSSNSIDSGWDFKRSIFKGLREVGPVLTNERAIKCAETDNALPADHIKEGA